MSHSLSTKLKLQPETAILTLNAPQEYKKSLGELPKGTVVSSSLKDFAQVHWFVMNKAQMEKEMPKVLKLLKPGVFVWVFYPKGTSKIQTDLTRDKGWDKLLDQSAKLTWVSLISFDDTWSAFGFRAKTESDKKKETKPKAQREIFKWVDPETKSVTLPEDLDEAIRKNKKAGAFFEELSFTNKKEYIEWIVTAKKEETRMERVEGTVEKLNKGWKNPRNL
jgi:hypothetical protein